MEYVLTMKEILILCHSFISLSSKFLSFLFYKIFLFIFEDQYTAWGFSHIVSNIKNCTFLLMVKNISLYM